MSPSQPPPDPPTAFALGDWRVEPSLNRLQNGDRQIRLEPKIMDVLVLLAAEHGRVVSRNEVADAVWTDLFITESVITRAISALRRAFGDDSKSPHFIETIPKRGYRLLVPPAPLPLPASELAEAGEREFPTDPHPAPDSLSASRGSSVGQWVRGQSFVGREDLLDEVLQGARNGLWLLGTRAIGKTSTLRQLEWLVRDSAHWWPLFLDLQGIDHLGELDDAFAEALGEGTDRLQEVDLTAADLAEAGFLTGISRLRRELRRRDRRLLLLLDEAEELVALSRNHPGWLRKLRRSLLSMEGVRSVLAAGPRLWQLADQRDDTSPFLHGFAPPLPLGPLSDAAAHQLLAHLGLDRPTADRLLRAVGGHPTLLQLIANQLLAGAELDAAVEGISTDPTMQYFFAVDFDLLSEAERRCLAALAREDSIDEEVGGDATALRSLELLGMVQRGEPGGAPRLACPPFERWLQKRESRSD